MKNEVSDDFHFGSFCPAIQTNRDILSYFSFLPFLGLFSQRACRHQALEALVYNLLTMPIMPTTRLLTIEQSSDKDS